MRRRDTKRAVADHGIKEAEAEVESSYRKALLVDLVLTSPVNARYDISMVTAAAAPASLCLEACRTFFMLHASIVISAADILKLSFHVLPTVRSLHCIRALVLHSSKVVFPSAVRASSRCLNSNVIRIGAAHAIIQASA